MRQYSKVDTTPFENKSYEVRIRSNINSQWKDANVIGVKSWMGRLEITIKGVWEGYPERNSPLSFSKDTYTNLLEGASVKAEGGIFEFRIKKELPTAEQILAPIKVITDEYAKSKETPLDYLIGKKLKWYTHNQTEEYKTVTNIVTVVAVSYIGPPKDSFFIKAKDESGEDYTARVEYAQIPGIKETGTFYSGAGNIIFEVISPTLSDVDRNKTNTTVDLSDKISSSINELQQPIGIGLNIKDLRTLVVDLLNIKDRIIKDTTIDVKNLSSIDIEKELTYRIESVRYSAFALESVARALDTITDRIKKENDSTAK